MILPLLACLTLVGASSAPLAVSSLPFGNEPAPQCAVFNDEEQTITFEANEVNNYTFHNAYDFLSSYYVSEGEDPAVLGVVSVNDISFSEANSSQGVFTWITNPAGSSSLSLGNSSYKFEIYNDNVLTSFNTSFVWYLSGYGDLEGLYLPLKTAIQADIEANQSGMSGVEVVNEIVDILAGGLTSLGSSLGGAIATFAQSLAFQDGELSVYFVLIVVFAGVSLAIGLTTLLFNWLTNLGR